MQKKVITSKDTMILQISLTIYLVKSFKTINHLFYTNQQGISIV
jgi:hypothetical protein